MDVTTGDTVTLQFGVSTLNENTLLGAFKNMAVAASKSSAQLAYDSQSDTIFHDGNQYDFNGIIEELEKITMDFEVGGFYDEIGGKFSKIYGNVAIVDCNYLAD